jgi:hypothetical protein
MQVLKPYGDDGVFAIDNIGTELTLTGNSSFSGTDLTLPMTDTTGVSVGDRVIKKIKCLYMLQRVTLVPTNLIQK